ncbi:MAG: hypothetical protein R3277_00785 [Brumimicrobium sp.]|nr:hypothetical protein [Brumimicrobium sp.]
MKKYFYILLTILFLSSSHAQLELEAGNYPFHQIVEWKGVGTLLMNSDPDLKGKDFGLTLLDTSGLVAWNKLIYPAYSRPSLILSENSNYIYFLDFLKVRNNRISYIQLNRSGSYVSNDVDVLKVVRAYGYTNPDDVVLQEVFNTPKALVMHLTLEVKEKKIVENFFVTITHHNNRIYHVKGPETNPDMISKGKEGLFNYAGGSEEDIYFSRIIAQDNRFRAYFYPISPKAVPREEYGFMLLPDFSPIPSEIMNYDLSGSYYQAKNDGKTEKRLGVGIYKNAEFYYVANDEKDRCVKVYGKDSKGEIAVLNQCEKKAEVSRKYNAKIYWMNNMENIIVVSKIEDTETALIIDTNKVESINAGKINADLLQINPTSFKVENKSSNFVHLVGDKVYTFDLDQLGEPGKAVFKER